MLETLLAAATIAASPPALGDTVTYMLGDQPRCARVAFVDTGADQRTWAWIVSDRVPQWTLHVPVKELTPGCADGRQEAKK